MSTQRAASQIDYFEELKKYIAYRDNRVDGRRYDSSPSREDIYAMKGFAFWLMDVKIK